MDWTYLLIIFAYVLAVCDPICGVTGITNLTLVDGMSPNEGRVEYYIPGDTTVVSACGVGIDFADASVICRQLGYPGVNSIHEEWPWGTGNSIAQHHLNCKGDEANLDECSLTLLNICSKKGGVICYDLGYLGCYLTSVMGTFQTPCEYGIQNLTIAKCVSSCQETNAAFTHAAVHHGSICFCGNASPNISQSDREDDADCLSPCTGRDIETCGGPAQIAVFNINMYLQNYTEDPGLTTCVSQQTKATTATTLTTTTTAPEVPQKTTEGMSSMTDVQTSPDDGTSSGIGTTSSSTSVEASDPSTTETMTEKISSVLASQTSQGMTSDGRSIPQTPIGTRRTTVMSGGRTPGPTDAPNNLGLYIGVGAGAGILVLIVVVVIVVFLLRWRRSRDKGYSDDHTILELRSRPEGSDMAMSPYPPTPSNTYSLENGHTNPLGPNGLNQGMEDSDYSMITDPRLNPVNNAQNNYDYEPVPGLDNPSGNPPEPVPRRQVTARAKNLGKGQRDSFPEYAVSQKMRKEPIGQDITKAAPSSEDPDDIADLYAMPDKSQKSMKGSNGHPVNVGGIDNALYICRGDEDAKVGIEPSEYALEKDDAVVNGEEEGDVDTVMIENDLYGT